MNRMPIFEMKNDEHSPSENVRVVRHVEPGLPVPDLVTYYELEKERKLYIEGDIDSSTLSVQRMILRWNMEDALLSPEERKPIWLYIFSPGGDVDCMWSLVDTISVSETPVFTVNMGLAASAASIIYLAGHKRYMFSRSKVLIHEGSARMAGDAVKVMDASDNYRKMIKQMKDYILSRTSISPAALNKQKCHDWELDSEYCLEHGVCDKIVDRLSDIL